MEEKMSHHCQALVLSCMDFRFRSDIRDFLLSLGLRRNYDMVSLAGATKDLINGDRAGAETIMKQIDLSTRLHSITDLIIIHHLDCGAYGGKQAFSSVEAERLNHLEDMQFAKTLILKRFPNLEIKKVLARISESDDQPVIDFEIVQ